MEAQIAQNKIDRGTPSAEKAMVEKSPKIDRNADFQKLPKSLKIDRRELADLMTRELANLPIR